jgi:hypothetical protein
VLVSQNGFRIEPVTDGSAAALCDPLPTPVITERILRPIVVLSPDDQRAFTAFHLPG